MPIWERYEVVAETTVTVKVEGRVVSSFKTFGEAKGGSNEGVDRLGLVGATEVAVRKAETEAVTMALAAQKNRRREIGYRDGD